MKNESGRYKNRNEFTRLKRKIIWQVMKVTFVTIVAGILIQEILIDGILQEPFAEGIVGLIQKQSDLDYWGAVWVYQKLFRNMKEIYMLLGFIILLLVVFYLSLSKFTKYFNEIRVGMDQLVQEADDRIELSSELDFMEDKMNQIRDTLKKRSDGLKEAEQRKNALVVYLAHDIKTPLTSVIGYINLMLELPDMPTDQKAKYLEITLDKAYRLEQLINELFDITKFNMQSIILEREELHLSYMLLQLAEEFYPVLEEKGKKALVESDGDMVIWGDSNKLARVFNNILKNAIAYSLDNTTIRINARWDKGMFVVTFQNQGKKIPEEMLNKIFEQFYRMDSSRASDTGGAGLGLAIAREIVLAHHGKIYAQSTEEYTTFTVELPANEFG